jgi:zinc protease
MPADLSVVETTLSNGLRMLVLPISASPVVVCDVFYRVGSVDDPAGASGLAHFVEHMLFKATARLPRGQIDRLVFLAGGIANAETSQDDTHYWSVFPADRWEVALDIEAERMARAAFDPEEVEAERRVIREERARELELPASRLDQAHLSVCYQKHPYRNPILGWPEECERIGVADLEAFYRRHYRPGAAVLVVVGPVEVGRAIRRAESRLGRLAAGPRLRRVDPPAEPPQRGRRTFHLREPGELVRGLLGWHTVPRSHPDAAALDVLADVLACGRKSRLWGRLVERDRLAGWIDAWHDAARLAGVFQIAVEGLPGARVDRLERAILDELTRIMHLGPTEAELSRSRARLEATWRWDREDATGLAAALGQAELHGHWTDYAVEHAAAMAVTVADVRRVAQLYLGEAGLTVGWLGAHLRKRSRTTHLIPPLVARVASPSESESLVSGLTGSLRWAGHEATGLSLQLARKLGGRPARCGTFAPRRIVLPNGLTLISERRPGTGVVAIELYCDAGCLREAKPGVANLTARLREEGTLTRSSEDIAEAVEDLGAQLEVHPTGLSLKCRAEDLSDALELAADLTLRPAFPADALTWVRKKVQAELRAEREDPAYRAGLAFQKLVYGDHPYGRDHRGTPSEIARLGLEDLLAHHQRFFVPDRGFMTVVGDYEPGQLLRLVRRHFDAWEPSGRRLGRVPQPRTSRQPRRRRIVASGEQVHVFLGHLGIPRCHKDYAALVILDHLLGGGAGLTSHLGRILRDQMGLAYAVSGGIADSSDLVPGALKIYVGTGADDADRAVAAAREVLEALHRGEFCDDEVHEVQQHLGGAWVMDYVSVGQRAERLLEIQRWGLALDEPLSWPDQLRAVTPRDVRRAARRHLHPDRLIQLLHGPVKRCR